MGKLLWILVGSLAMACGEGSGRSEGREAAADEDVEIGSGKAVNPQVELDSADDARFEVDTINSGDERLEQTRGEDL